MTDSRDRRSYATRNGGSTPRRVAVFREKFLPPSETFIRDHVLHLPNWEPTVVTTQRVANGLETPGVHIQDTSHPSAVERFGRALAGKLGASASRLQDRALANALRRGNPEVVHAHFGPDGALVSGASRRLGIPLVVTFHGYDATVHPEFLRAYPSGALLADHWDELMQQAAAILTCSDFLRQQLTSRGADPERLHVIPNGIYTASVEWTPPPADGGLLFVGRLVEKKGCEDLLRAVARIRRAPPVQIIGEGPLRAKLEQFARDLSVDAQFLGVRSTEEVLMAMQQSSIVAMPSKQAANGDCEGMPVASLEASAMGRPVVGYRHSGLVETVISGETGLLAPEGDIDGLTELLNQLIGNEPELRRLALNARRHIEKNFELSDCLRRIEAVYAKVATP